MTDPAAPVDRPRPIRPGEELDTERLLPYLQQALGLDAAALQIEQFPGGHSNLTYLLRADGRELVLRRPPFGSKVRTAHDMGREYRILARLHPVFPRAPRPLLYCEDESVLGARFYLMERIEGAILRRSPPPGLTLDPATMRRLCDSFVDVLAELHALDYRAAGLGDLGNPEGYVQRQVSGWSRRYADAQTGKVPEFDAVDAWLFCHIPPSPPPGLIHNDYKFDNLVLDPGAPPRIRGILDWEMSTVGDPLMDLGTALCYWVDPGDPEDLKSIRFGPTHLPGALGRRQIAERYADKTGRDLTHLLFYYCFGLFKTAVVVQQIYFRYKTGLTRDPRFATFDQALLSLVRQAQRALERGTI